MRKLGMFNNVSVDGYFVDAKGDMSWAHSKPDAEWNAFVEGNASGEGELLFGRDYLRHDGEFLADGAGHEEYAYGGRGHEQQAEGGVFKEDGPSVVEQHEGGKGRAGGGSTEDEASVRAGPGDFGEREHRVAIGGGRID